MQEAVTQALVKKEKLAKEVCFQQYLQSLSVCVLGGGWHGHRFLISAADCETEQAIAVLSLLLVAAESNCWLLLHSCIFDLSEQWLFMLLLC